MIGVALKGLAGRKLRAALTAVAIVLGVAMISGTYILTDTIKSAFGTVFTEVYKRTDVVITGKSALSSGGEEGGGRLAPAFSETLLATVRRVPGVAEAQGSVSDAAQLVGRDGKVISGGGAPALAFSVHGQGNQRFNPLQLVAGRWPSGPGEIAIDANTAERHDYVVGETIGAVARGAEQRYRIAGIAKFGGVSSLGGATMAIFDLPVAQRLFHKVGELDSISVADRSGHTPAQVVREIRPLLPPNARVRTAAAQAQKSTEQTNGFLAIIQDFLLAFAGIALFVGSFVIANTLSITIAQRTRELATLRTLGATRRQVLRSVLLEAFAIGLFAAVVGLFLGLGLAKGLNSLFVSLGIDLPQASTVFATRTVIVSLAVGVVVTVLAATRPALRATHVAPIAAVREGALLPPSRFARFGTPAAAATIAVAVALMLAGLFVSGLSTGTRLLAIGLGAAGVFLGVAMVAKLLVPPLAAALGWPATKIGGAAGRLARANAMRNPARTASTASALMIGLALVTLVSVLAAGLKSTFESSVNQLFHADYALTSTNGFSPTSIASEEAVRGVPGVQVVAGVRAGRGRAFGGEINVGGSRRLTSAGRSTSSGSTAPPRLPAELGAGGAFVSKAYAKELHLHVGSPLAVETPLGRVMHLTLQRHLRAAQGRLAVRRRDDLHAPLRRRIPEPAERVHVRQHRRRRHRRQHEATRTALAGFPDAKIQTESQFKSNQETGHRHAAQPALRAALAVDRRQPLRDRQHARADGLRAHARARHAARGRHDPPPGAPHDPPREHRHRPDRRRARDPRSASCLR